MSRVEGRRCVVTGAGGLIGGRVLPELVAGGWEVHALSHSRPAGLDASGVEWHEADLAAGLDEARLPPRTDAVVYLAQSEHFREFPERARDVFAVNTEGVLRLLDYARRAGASRFVLGSSGGVYGSGDRRFSEELDLPAQDDLGFYLGTKLSSEILVQSYATVFDVVILRFFFVYGSGQRGSMLVPRLVDSVRHGVPIQLQGPDGLRLNPIHVSDAARAVARSLSLGGSEKVNVGGPAVLTLREIGDTIGRLLERAPVYEAAPGAHARNLVGDIAKMSRLLGAPEVHFAEGICELIEGSPVEPSAAEVSP
jgi:UDP-glucose 4-epimerase